MIIGTKAETRSLLINVLEENNCFKCGKEGHPESHYPEGNNKDNKKREHIISDYNKYIDSRFSKSIKSDISIIRIQMKKTFNTMEAKIDTLGDEVSDLTSYNIKYRSENSQL